MSHKYFCLTNDPDHGLSRDYKKIFNNLSRYDVFTTSAVFCTLKDDNSVLSRHCTTRDTHSLENKSYLRLMLEAKDNGHEIAFHGYSQVSDTRDEFLKGLDIYKGLFGEYPKTYIEHGYHPKKHPPANCKSENLAVMGSLPESKHYIKDIIAEVFDSVWTHDFLVDDALIPLPLDQVFVRKDDITYFKRWRNKNLDELFAKVSDQNNTIVAYTHFGYTGYKSPREKYFFWQNQKYPFENWLGRDSFYNSRIISERLNELGMKALTINRLYKKYNET